MPVPLAVAPVDWSSWRKGEKILILEIQEFGSQNDKTYMPQKLRMDEEFEPESLPK